MTNFLKYGLYAGLLSSAVSTVLFIIKSDLRFNTTLMWSMSLILPIVFMVLAVKSERSLQEGFISFGEALKTSFLTYLVYAIISMVVGYVLMQMYSVDDWESMAEFQRNMMTSMFSMAGMDQVQMDEALAQFTAEGMKEQMSGVGSWIMSLLSGSFIGLIFSLVMSAIMKRNPTP